MLVQHVWQTWNHTTFSPFFLADLKPYNSSPSFLADLKPYKFQPDANEKLPLEVLQNHLIWALQYSDQLLSVIPRIIVFLMLCTAVVVPQLIRTWIMSDPSLPPPSLPPRTPPTPDRGQVLVSKVALLVWGMTVTRTLVVLVIILAIVLAVLVVLVIVVIVIVVIVTVVVIVLLVYW